VEEIKILYLIRSSEFGGFIHVSEKEALEESDAMDAKLVLAIHQHDSLQCLSRNKLRVTIRAINKLQKMSLQVTLVSSDNEERNNLILCNVKTPYGYCWFKLKNFNNYVGQKLKDMKIFDLEPLSDTLLEELCLNHQFFFVGS
jgi:hypothetical protein